MEQLDTVVIGAGVVGLAVGRALAAKGREVLVLEAEGAIGTMSSARNSEVIHAGLYYPKNSLKAQWCVAGKNMLYDYCRQRQIEHKQCGKLVVATTEVERVQLDRIAAAARDNGVVDLQNLSAQQAKALEPALTCLGALFSPSTGIVDSHGLMMALQADIENAQGMIALQTEVVALTASTSGLILQTADQALWCAQQVVNCAGHGAVALARTLKDGPPQYANTCTETSYYAKGNYFSISGRSPFSRLIYPVPQAAGLGVHLTLDLGGQAKFGPDVQWVDDPHNLEVNPARAQAFYSEVRRYWPELPDNSLVPAYAGMRPKLNGPGQQSRDFVLSGPQQHGVAGLVHLMGIESPGLTSCLAIADAVAQALESS